MSPELKSLCDRLEGYTPCLQPDICIADRHTVDEAAAKLREMAGALEVFVRHGVAAGAFSDDPDPIRFYTDTGYREVPVADFQNARAALGGSHG